MLGSPPMRSQLAFKIAALQLFTTLTELLCNCQPVRSAGHESSSWLPTRLVTMFVGFGFGPAGGAAVIKMPTVWFPLLFTREADTSGGRLVKLSAAKPLPSITPT